MQTKNESACADADMKGPFDSRVRSLRAFDSVGTWPAMRQAVLGRVEWNQRDTSETFCGGCGFLVT